MKNLLVAWIVLLLYGCATYPQAIKPMPEKPSSGPEIYLVNHGWHTGIILAANDVNKILPQLKVRFPQREQWYEIGWGDKGFYQSQEITTRLTLQAMFWPSGAVMHVVAFSGTPESYFSASAMTALSLTPGQNNSLLRYIGRSFARNERGELIPLKKGIYGDSQFYAANGRYGIFNTCNKWTAKGLESAGMTMNTSLKLTAGSVMKAVEENKGCLNRYCYPL